MLHNSWFPFSQTQTPFGKKKNMGKKMHLINTFTSAIVGCLLLVSVISATKTHYVGGDFGWNLPPYKTFYDDWSKNNTFAVGDILSFQYKPGLNTVVWVNEEEDYTHCIPFNAFDIYFQGSTTVVLDKPGDYYFFCHVGKHCEHGQKLWVSLK